MNQDEARLFLTAWDYFLAHPGQEWEGLPGISSEEFFRLVLVITGGEDLKAARAVFEKIAAGEVFETVPSTLIEKTKEDKVSPEQIKEAQQVTLAIRRLTKAIKGKGEEGLAEKEVAKAELQAVIKRTELPPSPRGEPATPSAPPPPGFSIQVKDVSLPPAPLSIKTAVRRGTLILAFAPFNIAVSIGRAALAEQDPEKATAVALVSKGITPGKLAPLKTQALAAGISPNQFDKLAKSLSGLPTGSVIRALSGYATYSELADFIYAGRELSISPTQIGQMFLVPSSDESTLVIPQASFVGGLLSQVGQRLLGRATASLVGRMIGGGAGAAVAGGAAGGAAAGATTGAGVGAAVGAAGGPLALVTSAIGAVIGWVSTEVLGRLAKFLKENKEAAIALVLVSLGVFIGGPIGLGLLAFGGLAGLGALAGGFQPLGKGAGGIVQAAFIGLTSIVLPSLGIPLAIAFISLPIIIAVVFFIINSGAFLAPKEVLSTTSLFVSPYVDVRLSASPTTSFSNDQLPVKVDYKAEILAKKGPLTNVSFGGGCAVIKKGKNLSCPKAQLKDAEGKEIGVGKQAGLTLEPLKIYVLTFSVDFSRASLSDSIITETFTLSADTQEKKGLIKSESLSVIIGNPDTGCFIFEGPWPTEARVVTIGAIAEINKAANFVSKICGTGEISLAFDPQGYGNYGGHIVGTRQIGIYPLGAGTSFSALYTLAHETGHVLAQLTDIDVAYYDTPSLSPERPLCTYVDQPHPISEDFAETVALYLTKTQDNTAERFACLENVSFRSQYPLHWQFAKEQIFLENLNW